MSKPLSHNLLAAALIGLLASLAVGALWLSAPGLLNSWEWSTYDARMRLRGPAPASTHLLLIGRDEESDARFGRGIWDRLLFARVIAALSEAGAAVVAPDFHFAGAGPPERGGAAGDQALIEATRYAGNVVYPVSSVPLLPGLVERARGAGHITALPDGDGVYRSMPVSLDVSGRPVPAFGVTIAAAFLHMPPDKLPVATDARGRMLINYAGRWAAGPFPYLSFVDVWDAIQEGRQEELRRQVEGKIVLLLHSSLEADKRRTPLDASAPGGFIHANVANTILTGSALREAPAGARVLLTLGLALLPAWLLLSLRGWAGASGAAGLGVVYTGVAQAAFTTAGLVLPMLPPLFGLVVASAGTLLWTNLRAAGRIRRLESEIIASQRELGATREALARQESLVERLEEDLETVRAAADASDGKKQELAQYADLLRNEAAAAQAQAEATRGEIRYLEARLADLTAAEVQPVRLSDAELERLRRECEAVGVLTRDPRLLGLFRDLKKAAASPAPILLLGETGTGKELFAGAAHRLSQRAQGPFVPVNVAALPSELVESALFGHVKGAFTGADRDHQGYFEQAHQGTIFLDEIGDLPPEIQAKLLRVLQEKIFYRVGAVALTRADARVVAATNRDLRGGVVQGWFREDLYYRLCVFEFRLPPLRDRLEDVPLLAERFAREAAEQAGRGGLAISQGALESLKRRPWPGNIRELKSCLERAVILTSGGLLTEKDLQPETDEPADDATVEPDVTGDAAVLLALRRQGFDMQETAKELGWDRSTVMQRLKGMCFRALVEHRGDRRAAALALAGDPSLARVVEVKLNGYYEHLLELTVGHRSAEEALPVLRSRLKNLPERYLSSVDALVRRHFEGRPAQLTGLAG